MEKTNRLKDINFMKMLRIGIGSALAIMIAGILGIMYSTSAGIITLLTIQDTKKETILIALKRLAAFCNALIFARLSFLILGYTPVAFGTFLLLFVTTCSILKLQDGISMNAVLTTHFYMQESMSISLIGNEFVLLLIGMGIGIFLNLFMSSKEKEIKEAQEAIEANMKEVLHIMSNYLLSETKEEYDFSCFISLDKELEISIGKAYDSANNTLLSDAKYYIKYMEMRKNQTDVLKTIFNHIGKLSYVPKQAYPIAGFIDHVADSFHEYNNAEELLEKLSELYNFYSKESLPEDRKEFETRAVLYQILSELEYFLDIKRNFAKNLTENQVQIYWKKAYQEEGI